VEINCRYDERVNEQVIDGDYPRDGGGSVFLLWDVVVLGLIPFVIKHEDIRLVLIKD
jgi:hypothetical protein